MTIREETVRYPGHGGDPVTAQLFLPAGGEGTGSAVLLVHEVYGADRHMCDVARRFAAEGYVTLLPDLYCREGVPGPESTDSDPAPIWPIERIRSAVAGLPDRRALADLDAGLAFFETRDEVEPRSSAVVGFCMGGTLAFLLACTSTRVQAIVDFYGGPLYAELSANKPSQPLELALNLDQPLLAFFGEQDPHIPLAHVERLRDTLSAASKDFRLHVMPGAGHGFFNDARPAHHAQAAREAWQQTLDFLHENL